MIREMFPEIRLPRSITKEQLAETLRLHKLWLNDQPSGVRADLSGAYLVGVNLYGADLSWANLYGADLSLVDLAGVDLRSAEGIHAVGPIGSRGDFTYFIQHADCIMVKCGCWWGTLADFEKRVAEAHTGQYLTEYMAAIAFIKQITTK